MQGSLHVSVARCGLVSISLISSPPRPLLGSRGPSHTHLLLSSNTPAYSCVRALAVAVSLAQNEASFCIKAWFILQVFAQMSCFQQALLRPPYLSLQLTPSSSQSPHSALLLPLPLSPVTSQHTIISLLLYQYFIIVSFTICLLT